MSRSAHPLTILTLCALAFVQLLATAMVARAERLPTRNYGLADGLPSTFVEHVTMDSRGLLWLSTRDGLARFDGARFITYGTEHGLPVPNVSALLQSSGGEYWVATNGGGVCRMDRQASMVQLPADAASRPLFRCTSLGSQLADHVNTLYEHGPGEIYAGTDAGLFRLAAGPDRPQFRKIEFDPEMPLRPVSALLSGDHGDLWIGTRIGLVRLRADGGPVRYQSRSTSDAGAVREMARDREGRIWVAFSRGLLVLRPRPTEEAAQHASVAPDDAEARWLEFGEGEMAESALTIASDGRVWVGTNRGLMEFDGNRFRAYRSAHGLTDSVVLDIAEDHDGNVWIAALSGLTKLNREGFITYDDVDGLSRMPIHALFEDPQGRVFAAGGDWVIGRFESGRFISAKPRLSGRRPPWASQLVLLDRHARWWILGEGLAHFGDVRELEDLDGRRPPVVYTEHDGLPTPVPFRLFEDAAGDVWISGRGDPGGLGRWERATGRFHRYPRAQGNVLGEAASAFCDLGAGGLWIGFYGGGLLRYQHGRFTRLEGDGVPKGMVTAIHRDAEGRVWIGSNRDGLTRVDDPTAARPRFIRYTDRGLSSDNIRAIVSDADGTILAGSVRGLDRLDPRKGVLRHYTAADGLASDFVTTLLRDRHGRVWVGTLNGLSQLMPGRRVPAVAPPVWIGGLHIGGVPQPLSHLGQSVVQNLVLGPDRNHVEIDFYSVGFRPGQSVRYQYRVDAVQETWSAPTAERTVHYPRLAPGRYQFLVRAVTADGLVSAVPARVEFTVLPPIWQRWWFRWAAVLLVGVLALAGHRHRVRRLVETERVRTRIASDLHDDIGSSLSQIAILSEVTRTVVADDPRAADPLGCIARLARESVDAMSDIVWALDPHRDTPVHLAKRMRRVASDLLPPCGIDVGFEVDESGSMRLGPDVRREVFLVFKETLNNVVRHARATRVDVHLSIAPRRLVLTVQDDGTGVPPNATSEGQGLRSMRRRAHSIGGSLDVDTRVGRGTRITLTVPMARRRGVAQHVPT